MNNFRILSILLAFVLLLPVVTSLLQLDSTVDEYTFVENSDDKEQREERKSESKDEVDEADKILFLKDGRAFSISNVSSSFCSKRTGVPNFGLDVATPPPELV